MRTWLPALALVVSCGPGTTAQPDGGPEDTAGCRNDARVSQYSGGLTVQSSSGDLSFELVQSDPAPPVRGMNTWTVRVRDSSGHGVSGLDLKATAFMPDHGHGSSVVPAVQALSDGSYSISPLYLFMPGVWRVTLATGGDAGPADSAQFLFCIEG